MNNKIFDWILRLVPAIILLQTLFFKFSASEESVYIFTKVGAEPYGRIASGVLELIAGICLLYRPLVWPGSGLAFGVMSGAILSHIVILGIVVMDDGGQLFIYALITWIFSAILLWKYRLDIPIVNSYFHKP